MRAQDEVTLLLKAWGSGDSEAQERLIPIVYNELHRLAKRYRAGEAPGDCLQTTALIHEAFLRLASKHIHWQDRTHFFAVSARMMKLRRKAVPKSCMAASFRIIFDK